MTTTWVFEDILDRVAAMQKEAVAELNSNLPVAIGPAFHGTLPSVQNYLEDLITQETDERQWNETRQVRMLVLIAETTAGFEEEMVREALRYLQLITVHFQRNTRLTSALYSTAPAYLGPLGTKLTSDPGVRAYQTSGIGTSRLGMAMVLHVPIWVTRGFTL